MEPSGRRHRPHPGSLTAASRARARLRSVFAGLQALARAGVRRRELGEELELYLEQTARDTMAREGLTYDAALRRARVEMGSMESIKEQVHSAGWESIVDSLWQDLRDSLRQLRRNPTFSLAVVLTLALGIGANAAIFTLVHAVLLKPLPVTDPQGLYRIGDGEEFCCLWGGLQDSWGTFSYAFYQRLASNDAFQSVAAFSGNTPAFNVRLRRNTPATAPAPAQSITGELVSGNFFETLGIRPAAGRLLVPDDDRPERPAVAIMGYRTWADRFGADASLIGSTISIDDVPFTLIGVAPPDFEGARLVNEPPQLWIPLNQTRQIEKQGKGSLLDADGMAWLYAVGRLRPGVSPLQIESQLSATLRAWLTEQGRRDDRHHKIAEQHIRLTPGGAGVSPLRRNARQGLQMLTAASALVLLIACANVANLLLARGMRRQHQIALRFSLGATRVRLIRAALLEAVVLAFLGSLTGLVLASVAARMILLVAFRGSEHMPVDPRLSPAVFAFTLSVAVLTGMLFGVIPAWVGTRLQPTRGLRESTRSVTGGSRRPQRLLVIAQTALSVLLLSAAGLVIQSLRNLELTDFGFEPRGRLLATLNFGAAGYQAEQMSAIYDEIQARLQALPGVRSASVSLNSAQDLCCINVGVSIGGRTDSWISDVNVLMNRVSPRYFETIGTPLIKGRAIDPQDTASSRRVAVVDEYFARRFFGETDAIGQHFGLSLPGHAFDYEIVGVVGNTKYRNPTATQHPTFFLPFAQTVHYEPEGYARLEHDTLFAQSIQLAVAGRPESFERQLRETLAAINPNLAIARVRPYTEQLAIQFNQERLLAYLTGLFSLLALTLASVGLYGVTAYDVARRTPEIGMRIALGAVRPQIVALVFRHTFAQIAGGLLIGLPLAILAARLLEHQLFNVAPIAPLVLAGATIVLLVSALVACALPTLRAATIDPVEALRGE